MISMLPTRTLKLLEFVGFSGNKVSTDEEVHVGVTTLNTLPVCKRSCICDLDPVLGHDKDVCKCFLEGFRSAAASGGLKRRNVQVLSVQHVAAVLSYLHELHTR